MKENILDYLEEENTRPKRNRFTYLIPYFLYCLGLLLSAGYGFLFEVQYLIGLIAIIVTGIVFYLNKKKGVLINGIVIILGVFNLADFFPFELSIGSDLGGIFIGIDLINLSVAGVFLHINMEDFKPQFQRLIYGSSEMQAKVAFSKKNSFKNKFKNKSIEELNQIANNTLLVPEAQQAAKELMEEKTRENDNN